eukprot:gene366-6780_t
MNFNVKEYLKKKQEFDEKAIVELKKDIDNLFSLFEKGDENVEIPFTIYTDLFVKVFNFRPEKVLGAEFEKFLHNKVEDYLIKKIETPFKKLENEEEQGIIELFISAYKQTENIFTWIDRLCNYSYIMFEIEPASKIYPLFSQLIFDKPIVMKVVQDYIFATMKPIDDLGIKKLDILTYEATTPTSGKSAVDMFSEKSPTSASSSGTAVFQDHSIDVENLPELPEDVQELFSILYLIGKRPQHFGGEFRKLVEPYYEKLKQEEKKRKENPIRSYSSSYIDHYPEDDKEHIENLLFYQGKKESQPKDGMVDEILQKWKGKYDMLEDRHNYIQFLFPIRETGLANVQPMTKYESEEISKSYECKERLIKSYELMLDFYGIELVDDKTGEVKRSKNYKNRYHNLNTSSHNYLRVTRILKCLGLCGLESLKFELVKHFIIEVFKNKEIENCKSSLVRYWLPTIREEEKLIKLEKLIEEITQKRVSRKVYDKEERSWANKVVFQNEKDIEKYGKEKTFYNRDDDDNLNDDDIVDIEPPSKWANWSNFEQSDDLVISNWSWFDGDEGEHDPYDNDSDIDSTGYEQYLSDSDEEK